jgi:hypothetical protein
MVSNQPLVVIAVPWSGDNPDGDMVLIAMIRRRLGRNLRVTSSITRHAKL